MTVPELIFTRVTAAGFTVEAACALLANIQKESWFKPENLEDSRNSILGVSDEQYVRMVDNGTYPNFVNDAAGFGLAQWTERSRKQNFLNYFKSRGKSIGDLETQISFLLWEMKSCFGGIWQKCLTSHDLKDLTWILLNTWENPAEKTNNMIERYGYAQSWYKKFSTQKEASGITKQEAVKKVLDLARSEIGYREKASNASLDDKDVNAGGANWTKYARDLDRTNWYNGGKNGYAWCDVFVDWLFYKCFGDPLGRNMICQPTGSAGAGCLYSAQYYKSAGRWVTNAPQAGDQIFFTYSPGEYSHTGLVEVVNGDTVTTIEGNTSDSVGRRNYNIGNPVIAGYGRPKWELAVDAVIPDDPVTPSEPTETYPLLKKGAKGEWVKKLQEMLVEAGYDVGPAGTDGDFGNDTYYAVRRFQIEHNLEVDGEVGDNTWAALEEALKKEESPAVKPDPEPEPEKPQEPIQNDENVPKKDLDLPFLVEDTEDGAGPYVKLAQAALACWGYTIVIHGIFGKEMTEKVKDFQKHKGLEADGEIGHDTWKALLKLPDWW